MNKKITSYAKDISKASGMSLGITLIFMVIQTLMMMYTNISEGILPITNSIIMILSVAVGSVYISLKVKQKGWINGALIGTIYMLLMILLNVGLIDEFIFNSYVLIKGVIVLVTGVIGGMIGVNLK